MLFDNKNDNVNERILYKTKPNMILGCKKAIFGIIVLIIIMMISPRAIQFIGDMQVYLISYVKLSLTRYTAIAFFVIILINIIYIIWQLVGWYSMDYALTESRVIVKSGVLSTKKNYMPYGTIQDLNTSQSIVAKLFNVGTVSVFSAYDNNSIELKNISNPSEVEDIIFSQMSGSRAAQHNLNRFDQPSQNMNRDLNDGYYEDGYYDEFEPITPITHENHPNNRNYDYHPNEFAHNNGPNHKYEYEPYNNGLNNSQANNRSNEYNELRDSRLENNFYRDDYPPRENNHSGGHGRNDYSPRDEYYRRDDYPPRENNYSGGYRRDDYLSRDDYNRRDDYNSHDNDYYRRNDYVSPDNDYSGGYERNDYDYHENDYSQGNYYNQVRQQYSNSSDDYYHEGEAESHYDEELEEAFENQPGDMHNSSQKVIRRHFDKFKKQ